MIRLLKRLFLLLIALLAVPALAGPPYATDDPVPTDTGHWEIYSFVDRTFDAGTPSGVFGLDLNYGPVEDVQLTATLPFDFDSSSGGSTQFGDAELGVKWRLAEDTEHHRSLAIFPRVILPTARGSTNASVLLPVWGQQDLGKWSIFGGGGYTFHPGSGNRSFWQAGLSVTRTVSDHATLGAEVFHTGADTIGGNGSTLLGLGGNVRLAGPFSLLVSGGPVIEDSTHRTTLRAYAAVLSQF
jgi:hypothetical protein